MGMIILGGTVISSVHFTSYFALIAPLYYHYDVINRALLDFNLSIRIETITIKLDDTYIEKYLCKEMRKYDVPEEIIEKAKVDLNEYKNKLIEKKEILEAYYVPEEDEKDIINDEEKIKLVQEIG